METAVFGGGCFWCTEAVFRELRGVRAVEPGYAGGHVANPSYEAVCSGTTGHAEVIRIEYDPAEISYHDLLTVFFATHDPTQENRQGNDVGEQYRSAIFYANDAQKAEAEAFIRELGEGSAEGDPIVTAVEPLHDYYPAEEYHREYFKDHPEAAYCQLVISPKVAKVQKEFAALLRGH
ncbi:MAG TPA: peptide-methionine (S)-S-oxide reductase MsrA [Candidatus Paceibacterota bacterium]|nr:peptide-methionine (S)-S-oxide reductase MsrA [Candidatus Paceibacterota bacterium]